MSALAIWLGGATVLTSVAHYFGQLQYAIILVGVLLAGYLFYLPHSHIVSTHSKHSFTNQTHYLKILL